MSTDSHHHCPVPSFPLPAPPEQQASARARSPGRNATSVHTRRPATQNSIATGARAERRTGANENIAETGLEKWPRSRRDHHKDTVSSLHNTIPTWSSTCSASNTRRQTLLCTSSSAASTGAKTPEASPSGSRTDTEDLNQPKVLLQDQGQGSQGPSVVIHSGATLWSKMSGTSRGGKGGSEFVVSGTLKARKAMSKGLALSCYFVSERS